MTNADSRSSRRLVQGLAISGFLGLAVGLFATWFLHLVTTWLRGYSLWSYAVSFLLAGSMFIVGLIVAKSSEPASATYGLLIILVLVCELSWYWLDYRDFRARVTERAVASKIADAPAAVDQLLIEETGSGGFWGYLKWSAWQGATFDDDPVPAGKGAALINWGKRLLSIFWSLVWAFIGHSNG